MVTGSFTMVDGTVIDGSFVGFENDGKYIYSYPDGTVCEEIWSDNFLYVRKGENCDKK